MATFPDYKPTYSATKNSEPKIRTTQFGDGYQQRITFGLNQNPKEWRLTFSVSDDDANIIEAFLDARAADAASFDWTPPGEATSYKWICPNWTRELFDFERSKIDVTFNQVFEP
jgi:phage-related protein